MKRYGRPKLLCRFLLTAVCAFVLFGERAVIRGDDLAPASYRRVFVPAERSEDWPTHGERYLPMNREEFKRLINAANQRRSLSEAGMVQITAASHQLTLADDFSLQGKSKLHVALVDQSPSILRLTPWTPALTAAHWLGSAADSPDALVGLWPAADRPSPSFGVLVERSGELAIEWALPQVNAGRPKLEYLLSLPSALKQQVTIELPAEYIPNVSSGMLVAEVAINEGAARRWTFRVGTASQHRIQIRRPDGASPSPALQPRVSVNESYGIAREGVEYEAEFRLQPIASETAELRLIVPETLRVTEVFVNQGEADWRLADGTAGTIAISVPKTDSPINVMVRAVASLVLNDSWKLPKLAPENVFWVEGTTSVWVDPAISLAQIEPDSAILLNIVGVGRDEGGEAYRLQSWSRDASVSVVLAEKSPRLHVQTNLAAEFADSELTGRGQARIWSDGTVLHIEAALNPGWNLGSIEAAPPESLAAWHVSEKGWDRRLHIHLSRAATEQTPITLNLTARKRLRTRADAAKLKELTWLRFLGAEDSSGKLLVTDHRSRELEVNPTSIGSMPLGSLTRADREFFGNPKTAVLLAIDETPADATIRVQPSRPEVRAEAWTELVQSEAGFQHQTEIRCLPVKGAVSELVIAAARPLPSDAQWSLVGTAEQPSVQMLGSQDDGLASANSYEYRIRLASPKSEAFRLRVTWRGVDPTGDSVNSLTLPAATAWQSWAILRGAPASLKVDARGCVPAAAAPTAEGDDLPIRACLRLNDDPAIPLADGPRLTVSRNSSQDGLPGVICRYLDIVTVQLADGNQTHRMSYDLDCYQDHKAEIEIPPGVELVSARLNGRTIIGQSAEVEPVKIRISLAGVSTSSMLVLDVRGRRARLDARTSIAPPIPKASFPIQRGRWTISVPAPYWVEIESQRLTRAGWRQRLFGPLLESPQLNRPLERGSSGIASLTLAASASGRGQGHVPGQWASATSEFVTAPAPVQVRRLDSSRATWHMIWLISAVATAIAWPGRRSAIATIWAAMAVACLILPATSVFLPQAVLLGSLSGALARELLSRTSRQSISGASLLASICGLSMAIALVGSPARATEPAAPPPAVLYPIDEHGMPLGQDLYVPANLLTNLLPPAGKSRYGGAEYTLVEANYEIRLEEDSTAGEIICRECQLRFRLKTLQDDLAVELPLNRRDGNWDVVARMPDGEGIPLRWNDSGQGATIDILKAGDHEVVIGLIPRTRTASDERTLALHIPPLPGAQVAIDHPAPINRLIVDSARLSPKPEATLTIARKAAGNTLEVTWPSRTVKALAGVKVDQLSWLRVEPAAARLGVKLRLSGDIARLSTLELHCPPNLKLLPLAEGSPIDGVQTRNGLQQAIELKLRAGSLSPVAISLQFQLQRSMSLGSLQFPMIRVVGAEDVIHHIAVTVDPELQLRSQPPVGLAAIGLSEFEQAWGPLQAPPSVQYAVLAGAQPSWDIKIEPTPSKFTAREELELRCGSEDVAATYTAEIDGLRNSVLTHHLLVPSEIEVDDVNVTIEGEAGGAPLRWTRPTPDELAIFLSRPLNQRHTLRVGGKIKYDGSRSILLPQVALESFPTGPLSVDVYRSSEVLVESSELPLSAAADEGRDSATRFHVGRYVLNRGATPSVRLAVTPNNAQFTADALMTIDRSSSRQTANVVVLGRVTEGVVDTIKLAAPPEFQGPFIMEAGAAAAVASNIGGELGQIIEIKLDAPVPPRKEFVVRLSGVVSLKNDQRLRFPQLRVLNATHRRIFLALPDSPKNQSAEWTRRGLERQDLPESLKSAIGEPVRGLTYRAVSEEFIAVQRVFPNSLRSAKAPLAKTRVLLDDSGAWSAESHMIVQPGGGSSITLRMPAGAELLHAVVDGQPILALRARDGELVLPAGSRYLPRLVTVAYRHTPKTKQANLEFAPPAVFVDGQNLRMDRSFFQIEGVSAQELTPIGHGALLDQPTFDSAVRREQLAAIREASPLAFQLPEWELKNWFTPWVQLLDAHVSGEASPVAEGDWSELREKIGALVNEVPTYDSRDRGQARSGFAAYYRGGPDGKLELNRAGSGFGAGRWLLALVISAITVSAWRQPKVFAPAISFLERWPAAIGVVVGVFWWAYLTPGLLGLAIIALSLAAIFKARQKRRWLRRESQISMALDGSSRAHLPST